MTAKLLFSLRSRSFFTLHSSSPYLSLSLFLALILRSRPFIVDNAIFITGLSSPCRRLATLSQHLCIWCEFSAGTFAAAVALLHVSVISRQSTSPLSLCACGLLVRVTCNFSAELYSQSVSQTVSGSSDTALNRRSPCMLVRPASSNAAQREALAAFEPR